MSPPIVGISKLDGEILGFSYHSALLSISPIFKEKRTLGEMTIPLLSNVDGEDQDMLAGEEHTLPEGEHFCVVMEDRASLRVLMSISRITGMGQLRIFDMYCIEARELTEQYISRVYTWNEEILTKAAEKPKGMGKRSSPGPLGNGVLYPHMDYPTGLVLPGKEFLLYSEDEALVDCIREGKLRKLPDEAIELLKRDYLPHLRRYILTSFHHSHLCLEEPFFPMGLRLIDLAYERETEPYQVLPAHLSIRLPLCLLYLRDVLMTMKVIPFEENVVIRHGLDFFTTAKAMKIGNNQEHNDDFIRETINHPYVKTYRYSNGRVLPNIFSEKMFKILLQEDSGGVLGPDFDWTGLILTGSTIFSLILGAQNHKDYDIIALGSGTEEDLMGVYEKKFAPLGYAASIVRTPKSFRLQLTHDGFRDIDLYFGTVQSIAMYHSAPTNCYYDGETVCLYPRAFNCLGVATITDLVPLSEDRGLALRIKTYEKYKDLGFRLHAWHPELKNLAIDWCYGNETFASIIRKAVSLTIRKIM